MRRQDEDTRGSHPGSPDDTSHPAGGHTRAQEEGENHTEADKDHGVMPILSLFQPTLGSPGLPESYRDQEPRPSQQSLLSKRT